VKRRAGTVPRRQKGIVQMVQLRRAAPIFVSLLTSLPVAGASLAASQAIRMEHLRERGTVLRQPVLPRQFRGHWSKRLSQCAKGALNDDEVQITERSLQFRSGGAQVTRVVVQDRRRAVITIRSAGEETIFVSKKGLTLSPDGRSLTLREEDDTGAVHFRRCPVTTLPKLFIVP